MSAVGTGDQPDESADGEVLVGWCAGLPVLRFDPPGGRANQQAAAKVRDHERTRGPRISYSRPKRMAGQSSAPSLPYLGKDRCRR